MRCQTKRSSGPRPESRGAAVSSDTLTRAVRDNPSGPPVGQAHHDEDERAHDGSGDREGVRDREDGAACGCRGGGSEGVGEEWACVASTARPGGQRPGPRAADSLAHDAERQHERGARHLARRAALPRELERARARKGWRRVDRRLHRGALGRLSVGRRGAVELVTCKACARVGRAAAGSCVSRASSTLRRWLLHAPPLGGAQRAVGQEGGGLRRPRRGSLEPEAAAQRLAGLNCAPGLATGMGVRCRGTSRRANGCAMAVQVRARVRFGTRTCRRL